MQLLKTVKKALILDLDKNEVPTGWRWSVDRFLRFDDGSEQIWPAEIAATADEVREHIGTAVGKQAADIAADRRAHDQAIADLSAKAADDIAAVQADAEKAAANASAQLAAVREQADKEIAERDAKIAEGDKVRAELAAQLQSATRRLDQVAQADAQYDAQVKPLFQPGETRQ